MIPDRMRAVRVQPDGRLSLQDASTPVPARGEVLIRVAASPINPSDLAFLAGAAGTGAIPGLEGSGRVVAAGPGFVPRLLRGIRVAFASAQGGAWAEYVKAAAMTCVPLARRVTFEQGAMLIVNPMSVVAFFDIARRGRHAGIVNTAAASALGRMVIRLGRRRGVPVVNVVRRREHVQMLRAIGAEHVLDSSEDGFPAALADLSRRLRATLVLDAVGGALTETLVAATPPGSTIVAYSSLSGEPSQFHQRALIAGDKTITSFYLGHWSSKRGLFGKVRDIVRVQRAIGKGLETDVRQRFPLVSAQEAVETYRHEMSGGKVLLVPDSVRSQAA